MIDPIVAVSLLVAFILTGTALYLARRASERSHDDRGKPAEEKRERYVNGGWH